MFREDYVTDVTHAIYVPGVSPAWVFGGAPKVIFTVPKQLPQQPNLLNCSQCVEH